MKLKRVALFAAVAVVLAAGYPAAVKGDMKKALSDVFFIAGSFSLVVGLMKVVGKTGFFHLPYQGIKRYLRIISGAAYDREPLGAHYEHYRQSKAGDTTHIKPLIAAFAALSLSLVLALV